LPQWRAFLGALAEYLGSIYCTAIELPTQGKTSRQVRQFLEAVRKRQQEERRQEVAPWEFRTDFSRQLNEVQWLGLICRASQPPWDFAWFLCGRQLNQFQK